MFPTCLNMQCLLQPCHISRWPRWACRGNWKLRRRCVVLIFLEMSGSRRKSCDRAHLQDLQASELQPSLTVRSVYMIKPRIIYPHLSAACCNTDPERLCTQRALAKPPASGAHIVAKLVVANTYAIEARRFLTAQQSTAQQSAALSASSMVAPVLPACPGTQVFVMIRTVAKPFEWM